jgi:hypothetical protein
MANHFGTFGKSIRLGWCEINVKEMQKKKKIKEEKRKGIVSGELTFDLVTINNIFILFYIRDCRFKI